jgi:hypothetical protein
LNRTGIETAISSGGVLRALNKTHGPTRRSECSYGVLRREKYEPDRYPGHKKAKLLRDQFDGRVYVNVIEWKIRKVCIASSLYPSFTPILYLA